MLRRSSPASGFVSSRFVVTHQLQNVCKTCVHVLRNGVANAVKTACNKTSVLVNIFRGFIADDQGRALITDRLDDL